MITRGSVLACVVFSCASWLASAGGPDVSGGLDPAALLKPLSDSWPTYSGDYTGRRYSALKQIDQTSVRHLALAWTARLTAGSGTGRPAGEPAAPALPPPFG